MRKYKVTMYRGAVVLSVAVEATDVHNATIAGWKEWEFRYGKGAGRAPLRTDVTAM